LDRVVGRFRRGFEDARVGLPPRLAYDSWDTDSQWNYERGRCFAAVAPRGMPLRINGKINPAAVRLCAQRGVIL
jgi:hypothetical protein